MTILDHNKKDLVIGAITNSDWDYVKYWVNSLNASGFNGDKVLLSFGCSKETIDKITSMGVKVVISKKPLKYQIHIERFLHLYNYLDQNDYRYVIATDVRDVVFQKNPSEYLEIALSDTDLLFSSESLSIQDDTFFTSINYRTTFGETLYEQHKHCTIYNAGVISGKSSIIKNLFLDIYENSITKNVLNCDQSVMNYLIQTKYKNMNIKLASSEDGWAAQLGTSSKPQEFKLNEPSPLFDGNSVVTSIGKEYYIAHQYDRTPWAQFIENKFNI